jgi:hypothetical protein
MSIGHKMTLGSEISNQSSSHPEKGPRSGPMQPAKQDAFSVSRKRAIFHLPRYSRPRNDEIPIKAGAGPPPLPVILEPELRTV